MAYETPVINQNCHITIRHASVNDGENCGFILHQYPIKESPAVIVSYERDSDDRPFLVVSATIEISDKLRTPNGSVCPWSAETMLLQLFSIMAQKQDIRLTCSAGVFSGLSTVGPKVYLLESLPDHSLFVINFYRDRTYFQIPPESSFLNSFWDGVRSWESSYWR